MMKSLVPYPKVYDNSNMKQTTLDELGQLNEIK